MIARVVIGCLLNELSQYFNIPLDSVVLGDDVFECTYLVDVAGDGSLKLGSENGKRG
jgi:hypothetical protein